MWLNKKCQPETEIPVYRKILEMNAENMQKLLGHFFLFVGHKVKSGKYSENLMKICQKGTRESTAHNRASAETKFRPTPDCSYKQTGLAQIGQIGPNLSSPFLLTSSGNNNNNQNWV